MPELPEVEVVRRGLAAHATDATIESVETFGARVLRRHLPGPADFADRIAGRRIEAVCRRGKFLWLDLGGEALVAHLGMSGQLLLAEPGGPEPKHLHARFALRTAAGAPLEMHFVDQRTFGGLALSAVDAHGIPEPVAHIARDPFDPLFDPLAVARRITSRPSGIKRQVLDQGIVSGSAISMPTRRCGGPSCTASARGPADQACRGAAAGSCAGGHGRRARCGRHELRLALCQCQRRVRAVKHCIKAGRSKPPASHIPV